MTAVRRITAAIGFMSDAQGPLTEVDGQSTASSRQVANVVGCDCREAHVTLTDAGDLDADIAFGEDEGLTFGSGECERHRRDAT
jgi:hypothetical protein